MEDMDDRFKIQNYAKAAAWKLNDSKDGVSNFISQRNDGKWKFVSFYESIAGIQKNKDGEFYMELYFPGDPDSEKKQVLFDTPEDAYRTYIQILAGKLAR